MQEPTTLLLYISHTSPQYNEEDMGEAKLKVSIALVSTCPPAPPAPCLVSVLVCHLLSQSERRIKQIVCRAQQVNYVIHNFVGL